MRLLAALSAVTASTIAFVASPTFAGDPPAACGAATHGCTEVDLTEPGCSDATCCSLTCEIEPFCCSGAWDSLCVALAQKFCDVCGIATTSCISPATTPGCNQSECCSVVCGISGLEYCCETEWDQFCVKEAMTQCNGCEAPGAGKCHTEHDTYGCNDAGCCENVCEIDPACCTSSWDEACVAWALCQCILCGSPATGQCCTPHELPYCDLRVCCDSVCEVDQFCCQVRWDESCVEYARAICNLDVCACGDPFSGPCKVVHVRPGCEDVLCCGAVCALDEFCCDITWDAACVAAYKILCADIAVCNEPGTGSCFARHTGGGCDEPGCCGEVCHLDPNCCTFNWDTHCVDLAFEECTGCGDINTGSCFSPHSSPACANATCCSEVCVIDDFCCDQQWDDLCVIYALKSCGDPTINCGSPFTRSCYIRSFLPGCDDTQCCEEICEGIDPYCCEVCWDAICAQAAGRLCGHVVGCPKRGYCLAEHGNPGCNEQVCCSAVCELDPACCINTWDGHCVYFAKAVCFGQGVCPGTEDCSLTHGSPGCTDAACCNVVCNIDPVCCTEAWDSHCVTAAQQSCIPDAAWQCPCIGSCFEEHVNAGCDNESCCSGVCLVLPDCCTVAWDTECADFARIRCCGEFGCADISCGNWCAGSCFASHNQPFCNDAACCDAVCKIDSTCCDTVWDGFCASIAFERCFGQCGNPSNGSCFAPHEDLAGCSDKECCLVVCDQDPLCCNLSWDLACVTLAVGDGRRVRPLCELPECGSWISGDCCHAHELPACKDEDCCNDVCGVDPLCCDSAWDAICAGEAREMCDICVHECGDPCADSCCEVHDYPLCNDEQCCDAVCAIDPFCCDLVEGFWDATCVSEALDLPECERPCPSPECGDPGTGDCCGAHVTPLCNDKTCCDDVCQIDAFCCEDQWDTICVETALKNCPDVCEVGTPTGCFDVHPTPFCDDAKCWILVCGDQPDCCSVAWDSLCVNLAQVYCFPPPAPAEPRSDRIDRALRRSAHERPSRRTGTEDERVKARR